MRDAGPRLPVLDRLVDEELLRDELACWAGEAAEGAELDLHRASIVRNLGWLLNTRRVIEPVPDTYPEAQRSVLHFGLAELASPAADTETNRLHLARSLREAIERFEPRLADVHVAVLPPEGPGDLRVRFLIEASLRAAGDAERIQLDTTLDVSSGRFLVAGGRHA